MADSTLLGLLLSLEKFWMTHGLLVVGIVTGSGQTFTAEFSGHIVTAVCLIQCAWVQHLLHCLPSVNHPSLDSFDGHLRSALSHISNTYISDICMPIKHKWSGIGQVRLLALPAFLASAVSTLDPQSQILSATSCSTVTFSIHICLSGRQHMDPCPL